MAMFDKLFGKGKGEKGKYPRDEILRLGDELMQEIRRSTEDMKIQQVLIHLCLA